MKKIRHNFGVIVAFLNIFWTKGAKINKKDWNIFVKLTLTFEAEQYKTFHFFMDFSLLCNAKTLKIIAICIAMAAMPLANVEICNIDGARVKDSLCLIDGHGVE